ncbi:MAG: hypothetical protein JSU95_17655 [Betaproteobacteria bacterium]|nr:MAG: hypothetical protein JSU95_17655 [Betaproteobacteria bacterium]
MNRRLLSRIGRNMTRWISIPALRSLRRRVGALENVVEKLLEEEQYAPDSTRALNGQQGRQHIFAQIVRDSGIETIVETGTYLGDTTGWMHKVSGLPVYTSEINRHFHLLAKRRLAGYKDIHLVHGDSVDALRKLAASPVSNLQAFFYLDAHWYESLPLFEELRIIVSHWNNFVVMVDDFEVPGDDGYGFDDYGFRRSLSMSCFGKAFRELGLTAYFPVLSSTQETGARSGCVVLAKFGSAAAGQLDKLALLRSATD